MSLPGSQASCLSPPSTLSIVSCKQRKTEAQEVGWFLLGHTTNQDRIPWHSGKWLLPEPSAHP